MRGRSSLRTPPTWPHPQKPGAWSRARGAWPSTSSSARSTSASRPRSTPPRSRPRLRPARPSPVRDLGAERDLLVRRAVLCGRRTGRGRGGAQRPARRRARVGHLRPHLGPLRLVLSKVIPAAAGEAPYVLEGLMHGRGRARHPRARLMVLIGHRRRGRGGARAVPMPGAPRIRDLSDRRLLTIDRGASHGVLEPMIAGPASISTIEENWDEVLRRGRAGTAPRLRSSCERSAVFPRQNEFNEAWSPDAGVRGHACPRELAPRAVKRFIESWTVLIP